MLPNETSDINTGTDVPVSIEQVAQPSPAHVYSDEDEDEDDACHGFTLLDSMAEGRRGFDANEVEPNATDPIMEPPEAGDKTVDDTKWTRCGFEDVPTDDPEGYTQATRASQEAMDASSSPLALFLYFLPHTFWEYVAECSENKRKSLFAKVVSLSMVTLGRKEEETSST